MSRLKCSYDKEGGAWTPKWGICCNKAAGISSDTFQDLPENLISFLFFVCLCIPSSGHCPNSDQGVTPGLFKPVEQIYFWKVSPGFLREPEGIIDKSG